MAQRIYPNSLIGGQIVGDNGEVVNVHLEYLYAFICADGICLEFTTNQEKYLDSYVNCALSVHDAEVLILQLQQAIADAKSKQN